MLLGEVSLIFLVFKPKHAVFLSLGAVRGFTSVERLVLLDNLEDFVAVKAPLFIPIQQRSKRGCKAFTSNHLSSTEINSFQ
jgi:hypothetical protein